jgi:hypothetical protein
MDSIPEIIFLLERDFFLSKRNSSFPAGVFLSADPFSATR